MIPCLILQVAKKLLQHWLKVELATRNILWKKLSLKIFQNSQENTYARIFFLINLQAWSLQPYLKRDSGKGVFLWILKNF